MTTRWMRIVKTVKLMSDELDKVSKVGSQYYTESDTDEWR